MECVPECLIVKISNAKTCNPIMLMVKKLRDRDNYLGRMSISVSKSTRIYIYRLCVHCEIGLMVLHNPEVGIMKEDGGYFIMQIFN